MQYNIGNLVTPSTTSSTILNWEDYIKEDANLNLVVSLIKTVGAGNVATLHSQLSDHLNILESRVTTSNTKLTKMQRLYNTYSGTAKESAEQLEYKKDAVFQPKSLAYNFLSKSDSYTLKTMYNDITSILLQDINESSVTISTYQQVLNKIDKLMSLRKNDLDIVRAQQSEIRDALTLANAANEFMKKLRLVAVATNSSGAKVRIHSRKTTTFNGSVIPLEMYPVDRSNINVADITKSITPQFSLADGPGSVYGTPDEVINLSITSGASNGDSIIIDYYYYAPIPIEQCLLLENSELRALLNKTSMLG